MLCRHNFKILADYEDILVYQQETSERLDVNFPLEYLKRAKVVALVSNKNNTMKIHAAFLIVSKGPFRSLQQIPKGITDNHSYLKKRLHRCFEINGLWIDHKSTPRWARPMLYIICFLQICSEVKNGNFYFVYSFDASKKKLEVLYQVWTPMRVFNGLVEALPGMSQAGHEIVEISSLKNALVAIVRNPRFFMKRFTKKRLIFQPSGELKND